jgi:glycopeptide antibiotics resistance protein
LDHEGAKTAKNAKREGREGFGTKAARIVAWVVVMAVAAWLLSLTLQEIGAGARFGRIRISAAKNELNLRPFVDKAQSFRNLSSPVRAIRRSAQSYLFIDALGNVAVFMPFGAALATATLLGSRKKRRSGFWGWWLKVSLAGLALSLFIEIGQLAIPGRVTDVDDVILNTLGTAFGALIVWGAFQLADAVKN